MERLITVKGVGKVSAKPDFIELSMNLSVTRLAYEATMEQAAIAIAQLQAAVMSAGFKKQALKTLDFNINPVFEGVQDDKGNYQSVFKGYQCSHALKLSFDFNMKKLSGVFMALAACPANPQFSVAFTIKDKEAVNDALLVNATATAQKKAAILAKAAGVELGQLLSIDYSWGDIHLYSPTRFETGQGAVPEAKMATMDIEPDNINVQDSVTFVWSIL